MSKRLVASGVAAGYGKKQILSDISFDVSAGEIVVLIGPNGVGKSTLLRTVAGFLPLMAGNLQLDGADARLLSREEHAKTVSVVMTERPKADWLLVRDIVAAGRYPYTGNLGILSQEDWQAVDEAMEALEIRDLATAYFDQLSDGQRQRVMLAKSVATKPKLLILDEPTSYLDIRYQLEFVSLARRLAAEQEIGIFLSIHELSIAKRIADRVLCLKNGTQDAYGNTADVMQDDYIEALYGIPKGGLHGI